MAINVQFSPRDIELLAAAFQSIKDPSGISLDYEKFAENAGFKSAKSANTSWLVLKKKIMGNAAATSPGTPGATSKDASKKKTIQAVASDEGDDNDETLNDGDRANNEKTSSARSPLASKKTKAAHKPKAKTAPVKTEERDADPFAFTPINAAMDEDSADFDNEDETITEATLAKPKRKYTRKPKDPNAPPTKRTKKTINKEDTPVDDAEETSPSDDEEANLSIFGGDKPVNPKEEPDDHDSALQAASPLQLAAENALMLDFV